LRQVPAVNLAVESLFAARQEILIVGRRQCLAHREPLAAEQHIQFDKVHELPQQGVPLAQVFGATLITSR
jgi:hypothetical protein